MALRPRWEVESKEEQPSRPRWELGTESPIIELLSSADRLFPPLSPPPVPLSKTDRLSPPPSPLHSRPIASLLRLSTHRLSSSLQVPGRIRTRRMEDGGWKKKESPSVKLALAMALVRSNRHLNLNQPLNVLSPSATSDQIRHWKKKAKDRKSEIVHLREEIKLQQDGSGCELEPPIASCRCHFFEGCGDAGPHVTDRTTGDEHWIDNVLRRRFIRLVRWKDRRRRVERPIERRSFMEFESDDEIARLSTSIDFLVGLSDNVLAKGEVDASFSTFSHQAIDFILASLKNILVSRQQREPLEEITNGLIMRLIKRMCTPSPSQGDSQIDSGSGLDNDMDPQFCVQHIIRKLGKEEFIGQRTMLTLSQKIAIVAENLLLLDPFHDNYPNLDASMFLLIQLIEFLISDYVRTWLNSEQFDKKLFEEWVRSILKARKDLEILENMNGLYILYMDRVVALLAKEVGPATHRGKLDPQVFSKLLS